MSNVGKATDGMLDTILELRRNRDATKDWLETYQQANLINPDVASHLWEVLMGIEQQVIEEEDHDEAEEQPAYS